MKPTFIYTREVFKDGVHVNTAQIELTLDDVLQLMRFYGCAAADSTFDRIIETWNIQGQRENVNKMKYVYTRVYPE